MFAMSFSMIEAELGMENAPGKLRRARNAKGGKSRFFQRKWDFPRSAEKPIPIPEVLQ
jgi:hypothetical protein